MTRPRTSSVEPDRSLSKAVAVIGMCARFPGAPDYEAYWGNLSSGRQQIAEVPEDRFDWRRFYGDPLTEINKTNSKWGGFLDTIDRFDAGFFGISPREAELMDPQQRFMLEMTWHCLEDAGYAPSALAGGRIGVYIGVCNYDYKELQDQFLERMTGHRQTGSWTTCIPNRVSYWYNFHGPSFPIDTGCSSSLLTVHEAVRSLRQGECEMALAGGVSLICSPLRYIGFGQLGMLSPTGRCRTFDAGADGYVRGEGAGLVLLKPLHEALDDGDHIYGVILGSASNHGGKARTLTSPNAYPQSQVIIDAHVDAGVSPDTVTYIEAHGTGTPLGDPIEVHGLKRAFHRLGKRFGVRNAPANYCGLGTVKTHVGHLEAAAGVAGLIHVLLAMQHRALSGIQNFTSLNPRIQLTKSPFYLVEKTQEWAPVDAEKHPMPRRAGISSFGAGGANAHLVIEEAPSRAVRPACPQRPRLIGLSARSEESLRALAGKYAEFLSASPDARLGDISFTTTVGRDHLNRRLAVVSESTAHLAESLRAFAGGRPAAGLAHGTANPEGAGELAFLFTGQGSQYAGMGRGLYDAQPVFRLALDRCNEILLPLLQRPLLEVLYGEAGGLLDDTAYTQPALFSLEYSLAELWRSWGIRPAAVIGHSVGEYVAACVAGVFGLEEGLKLIAARGRLMQDLPRDGEMAAVFADESRVARALVPHRDHVSIAAVNGPEQIVISGRRESVLAVGRELASEGITLETLTVSHAFHSPLMRPILDAFNAVASEVKFAEPGIAFVSNVTGAMAGAEVACASYWRDHVLATVRFRDGIRALHEAGLVRFLEIGPKPTLSGLGRRCLPAGAARWLTSLRKEGTDCHDMLETLASLYVGGAGVNWAAVHEGETDLRIALPTYPFDARRHWLNLGGDGAPAMPVARRSGTAATHPLLGRRHNFADQPDRVVYESTQSLTASPSFLGDHRVFGTPVFPAVAFIEMMLASRPSGDDVRVAAVEDVEIRRPLLLADAEQTLQCVLDAEGQGGQAARSVRIFSRSESSGENEPNGGWRLHASGHLARDLETARPPAADRTALEAECPETIAVDEFYRRGLARGLAYGPKFQAVSGIRRGEHAAIGRVHLPQGVADGSYLLHPVVLDGCLQILLAVLPGDARATYLPVTVRRVRIWRTEQRSFWSHARIRPRPESAGDGEITADFRVFDDSGSIVVEIEGLSLRPASRSALLPVEREPWRDWLYQVDWQPRAGRGPASRSDYLPAPEAMQTHLRAAAATLLPPEDPSGKPGICSQLESVSFTCIVAAFRRNGFAFTPGDRFSEAELAGRLNVVKPQRRLLIRLLEILTEEGILHGDGDRWSVVRTPVEFDPAQHLDLVLEQYPESEPELSLLARTGPRLGDVLNGASDPLQLMFPEGDTRAATHLYEDSLEPRAANTLVARAVAFALENLPRDRTVRILEVGAGTGATTASVLPMLPADRSEYVFTDVTAMFLAKAKEKFRADGFVRYRILDIEKPPETQGLDPHSVDLALAANVVHATRDLAETVKNIRRILAPGGILILLEGSNRRRWIDLTFGLLEGWWRFADHDLRPGYPLIGPEQWKQLLARSGYDAIETVELPRAPEELIYPQSVVIARAGGRTGAPSDIDSGHWLVCADGQGVGAALAERLRESGDTCILALSGSSFEKRGPGEYVLNPTDPEQLRRLLGELDAPPEGVVHLWSLDALPAEALERDAPVSASRIGCGSALNLVQALVRSGTRPPSLWLITRGALRVTDTDTVAGVTQSGLWGMAKAIDLEHPELHCVRVDLDPDADAGDAELLLGELLIPNADKDDHVAFRGGTRYTGRLTHLREPGHSDPDRRDLPRDCPFHLHSESKGTLGSLQWVPIERATPAAGEIEIRVRACGLNFIDVMDALGLAPTSRSGYGLECAGEVTAVGEGVEDPRVGDEVVGVAEGCFRQFVITAASLVVKKPSNLSMAEAASIPANFLTAHYALSEVARVATGERVLVHAAAGGTGMAAVQLAQRAGAEVWGTASTGKWAALAQLGVTRVMNSRTLDFAGQVMEYSNGEGVDVVLNSLAGEFIPESLGVLKEGGRFMEIGKTGVWTAEQVAEVRPSVRYAAIDLLQMCRSEPAHVRAMLQHLMDRFASGELRPIPYREMPASEVVVAFRTMQGAKHVGKLVISMPVAPGDAATRMNPDATYLIVGGLGGLGPAVARWMADAGARHFAMMGRSGIHEEAKEPLRELEEAGVEIRVIRGDVSKREDVRRALEEIRASMPPLRGVIHSAGVLDDGILMQQSWERFAFVMGPKVDGAWHLHSMTRELPLDLFVLFSSVASLLGSKGQANHSAANAFLDSLAAFRRAHGLCGLSINWGAWSGIGAAARRDEQERWSFKGMQWIPPEQGIQALAGVLRLPRAQVGVAPVTDWAAFLQSRAPSSFFEAVRPARQEEEKEDRWLLRQLEKTPADERRALVMDHIRSEIRTVLGFDASTDLDSRTGFFDLGMDSLTSVELRNRLQATFGATLSPTVSFDHPNIGALTDHLMNSVLDQQQPADDAAPRAAAGDLDGLDTLSDDELAELLGRELSDPRRERKT